MMPPVARAQANVVCAANLPCTITSAWTFTGAQMFTQLNGCQYVNATQTFAQALAAAGSVGCIEVTPGTYTVSASALIPYGVTLRSTSGGILSIATGVTLTIAGNILGSPNGQIFAYVGTGATVIAQSLVEALWFPGANLGVQINNAALALNNAKGGGNTHGAGKIHIVGGAYSVPLGVINPQADVIISCDENQATAINFTGASGIALLFNVGTAGGTYYEWGQGIENCQLYGPGYPSGSGQAGTGIQIGDSTHATIGLKMENSYLAGFSIGLTWGNTSAWGAKIDHTVFTLNTQDFVYNLNLGGGTENIALDHVVFAPSYNAIIANDVVIGPGNTTTDIFFSNCSFDNGELVVSNTSAVGLTKPHFEYSTNTTTPFAAISGGAFVTMYTPVVQYDPVSGTVPTSVFSVNSSTLDIYSPKMNSNVAITNYLNATSSATRVWGIEQLNGIGGPTYSGGWQIECGTTTQTCNYVLGAGAFNVSATGGINLQNNTAVTGLLTATGNTAALTADWTCGTGGTVSSCVAATIIGSGGGVPLTFTLPLVARSYTLECDGVVGQATAVTANSWNLLTATNGATNVTTSYSMNTAVTAMTGGATTDQASTTTTFLIGPTWTLGGTATKMPFHIYAKIEGASASGTVVSLQLVAPTVGDLVTIYRGTSCRIF